MSSWHTLSVPTQLNSQLYRIAKLKTEFPGWDGLVPENEVALWTDDELYLFAGSGGYLRPAKRVNKSTQNQMAAPFSTLSSNIVAPKSDRPNGPATARLTTPKPELPIEASTDYVSEDEPENVLCMKEIDRAGVGRWFLDIDKWQPSSDEWAFMLSQLDDVNERNACIKFMFEKDRKLALGSRLLQRFCVREMVGIADEDFQIRRTKERKPYLDFSNPKVRAACAEKGFLNFNFNATHHGSVVALASEPIMVVGVDVMSEVDRPYGHERGAEAFFESFQQSFTREEWALIRNGVDGDRGEGSLGSEDGDGKDSGSGGGGSGGGDDGKFRRFYRLWALKEAYIKAHGLGLGIDLQTISFSFSRAEPAGEKRWCVKVDKNPEPPSPPWAFALRKVDSEHVVCVARAAPQHCWPGYKRHLMRPLLSPQECARGHAAPQPEAFTEVTFASLVPPNAKPALLQIRCREEPRFSALSLFSGASSASSLKREGEDWVETEDTGAGAGNDNTQATDGRHQGRSGDFPSQRPSPPSPAPTPAPLASLPLPWLERWATWLYATPQLPPAAAAKPSDSFPTGLLRILAVSDLHTDFKQNMEWVENLPTQPPATHLIVAGDVSHSLVGIERTLTVLKEKFEEVYYTVGNHELWLDAKDVERGDSSSIDKLMSILELCDRLKVRTRPTVVRGWKVEELATTVPQDAFPVTSNTKASKSVAPAAVVVVPLLSWYGADFFEEDDPSSSSSSSSSETTATATVSAVSAASVEVTKKLSHFERHFDAQCRWPPPLGWEEDCRFSGSPAIAPFFAVLNEQVMAEALVPRCVKASMAAQKHGTSAVDVAASPPPTSKNSFGSGVASPVGSTGGKLRPSPCKQGWKQGELEKEGRCDKNLLQRTPFDGVVSFSHFLPDPRLYRFGRKDLKRVMGSQALAEQVVMQV